ncbi:MAG: SMP-30/gluconolactonase/LRE family protein [Solirubrobacteraceae bacterium]
MGVAFNGRGELYTVDNTDGNLYRFSSAGGTADAATRVSQTRIPGYLVGLAFDKAGDLFVAREEVEGGGDIAQLDPSTGAVVRVVASGFLPLGLATDPVSGDLFVTVVGEPIKRISAAASGSPTVADYGEALTTPDGIAFGPEGTLYTEDEGVIISVTGTGAAIPGIDTALGYVAEADGIAIAETTNPSEPPFLAVNSNDGSITKVDLASTPAGYTTMVTGGSRGDLVAVGPDSCLYATQFESIEKVTAGDGSCPFYPSGPFHCSSKIGSVTPSSGQVTIGDQAPSTLTISGRSFCPGTEAQFGNGAAIEQTDLQSPNSLTVTVPPNATTGRLQLIDPYGYTGSGVPFVINNYRDNEAFQFLNDLGVGRDVTWADVAAAYGANAYQAWSPCRGCADGPGIIHNSAAQAIYEELRKGYLSGLCFGFSLGSLRLSQGLDPLVATAQRSDPTWNQPTVWDLPPFESNPGAYGQQMRHYLYQQAIRQFSTQNYDLNAGYLKALKDYPHKLTLGAYVLAQVDGAFGRGLPIVEIFTGHGGHAVVGYALQSHPDGSFDLAVYDPDDPFSAPEGADGLLHNLRLAADSIHVATNGNWSFSGGLGATWSGPARDMRVLPFASLRGTLDPLDKAYGYVSSRGPILQATDGRGRPLYDKAGYLLPVSRRAGDLDALNAITGTVTPDLPMTGVLLDGRGTATETVASGTLSLAGDSVDGEVSSGGGRVRIATGGHFVSLAPSGAGRDRLELSQRAGSQDTVTVSGRFDKPVSLSVGAAAAITVRAATHLRISVQREGPGQPPQVFESDTVVLGAGSRLELGSPRALPLTTSRLSATVIRRGRRTRIVLVNRAPHPAVRIVAASANRAHNRTSVRLRLAVHPALSGELVVGLSGARHVIATRRLTGSRATVTLSLPLLRRGRRLSVWAVAITHDGKAGRPAGGRVTVR